MRRRCLAQNIKTLDQLRNLIVLEEFKNCGPEKIVAHIIMEKSVKYLERVC